MTRFGQQSWLRNVAVVALALLTVACGKDAVVGGSCRQGLTECNLRCVDLQQDPANCGRCGNACAAGQICSAGICEQGGTVDAGLDGQGSDVDDRDGSVTDAAIDSGVSDGDLDVSVPDGNLDTGVSDGELDVSTPDGESDIGGADNLSDSLDPDRQTGDGLSPDAPICTPPYNTPEHCGNCTTRCVEPTPLCGLQGESYTCVARCDPPLSVCGTTCVNTSSDEKNCGMCDVVCPSGICQAGVCAGKGYGHQIVIGTDYADSDLTESSAQVTMLGNAVFPGAASMVRVLAYDEFGDAMTMMRIEAWLVSIAAARGKSLTIAHASDWNAVPMQLTVAQHQVFLIYDQARAPAGRMATAGTLWNVAMSAFAKGGGNIVALDGGSAGQMKDLLTNGGLLAVTGETDVSGSQLNVDAPTDVVGQNLPDVFAARNNTVAFTTTQVRDNYHVFVVTDSTGMLPVVVHSVPKP